MEQLIDQQRSSIQLSEVTGNENNNSIGNEVWLKIDKTLRDRLINKLNGLNCEILLHDSMNDKQKIDLMKAIHKVAADLVGLQIRNDKDEQDDGKMKNVVLQNKIGDNLNEISNPINNLHVKDDQINGKKTNKNNRKMLIIFFLFTK